MSTAAIAMPPPARIRTTSAVLCAVDGGCRFTRPRDGDVRGAERALPAFDGRGPCGRLARAGKYSSAPGPAYGLAAGRSFRPLDARAGGEQRAPAGFEAEGRRDLLAQQDE